MSPATDAYTEGDIARHRPHDAMIDAIEDAYSALGAIDEAIVQERLVTVAEFNAARKAVGSLLIAARVAGPPPSWWPSDAERRWNEARYGDDRDPSHPYHQPE